MVKMTLCYCDKLHSLVFIIIDKRTEDIYCLLVITGGKNKGIKLAIENFYCLRLINGCIIQYFLPFKHFFVHKIDLLNL